MNIIITKIDEDINEKNEIISKDIICPECKENENDIENKNDKKVDDFNDEDEEIKAIHQKIDKELKQCQMNVDGEKKKS